MQDTLRMKVFQSREDLFSEILGSVFFETAIFTQATSDGTTRDILQKTWRISEVNNLEINPTYMLRKLGVSSNPKYWTMFG